MNQFKSIAILLTVCVLGACSSATTKTETKTEEATTTTVATEVAEKPAAVATSNLIEWEGFKVIGGGHKGTLAVKENKLEFTDGVLSGGSVTVDMTSLVNTDQEGEWKEKLEKHLISADFFSTEKFPTSTLTITAVKVGAVANTLEVTADLTIKETTLAETFVVTVAGADHTAVLKIDRTKYDIKYGSNNFFDDLGDKAISNEFALAVAFSSAK